jgi:hypothetical protein
LLAVAFAPWLMLGRVLDAAAYVNLISFLLFFG